ncbi:MAG: heavy metal translocating P-type ATPase [Haloarculaceae archaeon]
MSQCTLCDLPTPDPPVTDDDVHGSFCCRGCLEVARTLDDAAAADAATARAQLREPDDGDGADEPVGEDAETAYFAVDGMHCATCEAFLESRARDVPGVAAAEASYAGDALKVSYDPETATATELPDALSGYGYRVRDAADAGDTREGSLTTGVRLVLGGFFGMMVMLWYVLFLYPIYLGGEPLLPFFDVTGVAGRYLLWNVAVFAGAGTAIAGYPIFRGALVSLRARRPNMDLLVALAAGAAFGYSVVVLALGGWEVYFDVSVVVVLAVTLGDYWETTIKDRAAAGLADLTEERVDSARVRTADGVAERPIDDVGPGDELVVETGARVPLDGTVVAGDGAVDESLLTGEARPRAVGVGDEVVGGSVLVSGGLSVAVADDAESTLDRLVATLWEVQSTHGGVQRLADRVAAVFVPAVLVLAALTVVGYLLAGAPAGVAVLTGLSVLVVSCPCALGLATPLAVSTGVRAALDAGAVVTETAAIERSAAVDVVAFDKTGTLTTGEMTVESVVGDESTLDVAAALERYADHPVASAVCAHADAGQRTASNVERHAIGVSGTVDPGPDGEPVAVLVGRPALFDEHGWAIPDDLRARAAAADDQGQVPVVVGIGGEARALALAGDDPRPEWREVVAALAADCEVVVLTGDEGAAADRFRDCEDVSEVFAGVPPEGKSAVIDRLRGRGTVAMVGDGTNDAPALAAADIGIALADGAALAADAADVVVTSGDVCAVPAVLSIATATRRRVRENLAWAFCYNAVAIPLALAGVLNPLLAALAMAASSLLVVANSVRAVDADRGAPGRRRLGRVRRRLARALAG